MSNRSPPTSNRSTILIALQPAAFQRCFQEWITNIGPIDSSDPSPSACRLISIDCKTCRGSEDAAHHLGALHIVSAWASEEGLALGQVATDEKSNEIRAIPLLLEQIALENTIVTIDAMRCQKEIVEQIVNGGGDAVITVKRSHWSIESMHWVLDVTFRVDDHRTREGAMANNLSWLRRFTVSILKQHPLKDSLRGKMLRCGFRTEFLEEVLKL